MRSPERRKRNNASAVTSNEKERNTPKKQRERERESRGNACCLFAACDWLARRGGGAMPQVSMMWEGVGLEIRGRAAPPLCVCVRVSVCVCVCVCARFRLCWVNQRAGRGSRRGEAHAKGWQRAERGQRRKSKPISYPSTRAGSRSSFVRVHRLQKRAHSTLTARSPTQVITLLKRKHRLVERRRATSPFASSPSQSTLVCLYLTHDAGRPQLCVSSFFF